MGLGCLRPSFSSQLCGHVYTRYLKASAYRADATSQHFCKVTCICQEGRKTNTSTAHTSARRAHRRFVFHRTLCWSFQVTCLAKLDHKIGRHCHRCTCPSHLLGRASLTMNSHHGTSALHCSSHLLGRNIQNTGHHCHLVLDCPSHLLGGTSHTKPLYYSLICPSHLLGRTRTQYGSPMTPLGCPSHLLGRSSLIMKITLGT